MESLYRQLWATLTPTWLTSIFKHYFVFCFKLKMLIEKLISQTKVCDSHSLFYIITENREMRRPR